VALENVRAGFQRAVMRIDGGYAPEREAVIGSRLSFSGDWGWTTRDFRSVRSGQESVGIRPAGLTPAYAGSEGWSRSDVQVEIVVT